MPTVEFYLTDKSLEGVVPEPVPAINLLPEWYKKMPGTVSQYTPTDFNIETAKRCIPMLDALSAGYIIRSPWAFRVHAPEYWCGKQGCGDDECTASFSWDKFSPFVPVQGHSAAQLPGVNMGGRGQYPKFINPWVIKTPPGYSTLFVPILNSNDNRFFPFSGLVDTDTYLDCVNFPVIWNAWPFDGVVEQGTPIIQAIPFKRETFTSKVTKHTDRKEMLAKKTAMKVRASKHAYARLWRRPKSWR